MLVISAGMPRSNTLQVFNWMLQLLEAATPCHFYNARYIDFYDHAIYALGDYPVRMDRMMKLLATNALSHVVFKTHACPRAVFDRASIHGPVTAVVSVRNINHALRSLIGLWSNFEHLGESQVIDKCWFQMEMFLSSLAEIHDRCHIWQFQDIVDDRYTAISRLSQLMGLDIPEEVLRWILDQTRRDSWLARYDAMPTRWWDTYHDIADFHLMVDHQKIESALIRVPDIIDRLQLSLEIVKSRTGLDLLSI